ncbi:uncharacterized protein MYCFIDRAFT_176040 [Pseudocercospora fijiensis CIRAD86]|uniref:Uncharacterized protein n=1 Tax=Pseudocercospora fijiensis (strain CIRAD86) TaxID=383855 RepID=M2YXS4_PSEFD|nr:uncharacterized protein MYCFIDRAFT_176040 [Pseudocercospora fijiensis CIRAD86]EME82495.1 hypothetical protein MYCFIDRAFT_176040 [Pseudocercospora fijiensis CIRAD86]
MEKSSSTYTSLPKYDLRAHALGEELCLHADIASPELRLESSSDLKKASFLDRHYDWLRTCHGEGA